MKTITLSVYITLLSAVGLFTACSKSADTKATNIANGIYKGTFQRIAPNAGPIANVTLQFNNGSWTGSSDMQNYPALCEGVYQVNSTSQTTFTNYCAWFANIDFTLILSDAYQTTINGNQLTLTKQQGTVKDVYQLTKQ